MPQKPFTISEITTEINGILSSHSTIFLPSLSRTRSLCLALDWQVQVCSLSSHLEVCLFICPFLLALRSRNRCSLSCPWAHLCRDYIWKEGNVVILFCSLILNYCSLYTALVPLPSLLLSSISSGQDYPPLVHPYLSLPSSTRYPLGMYFAPWRGTH